MIDKRNCEGHRKNCEYETLNCCYDTGNCRGKKITLKSFWVEAE